jgi:phosphomevalonate kinase
MRLQGELAGVPVEPMEQKRLLDFTCQLPGVVLAGVPGAGGYDAIFAVVLDRPGSIGVDRVEEAWANWSELSVLPQRLKEDPFGLVVEDNVE